MAKLEIEQKFCVKNPAQMRRKILALKAKKISSGFEENQVFDLSRLGIEGILRLRKTGKKGKLTFKGPRLDGVYKKRVEVESDVDHDSMHTIFKLLNWKPFFRYSKTREEYKLGKVLITLDFLKGKGWFVEIEASEADIKKTALKLGFKDSDREERTYLEILGYKRPAGGKKR